MIQIKYNQNNKGRFEIVRFLPFVNEGIIVKYEENYFKKWLEGNYKS